LGSTTKKKDVVEEHASLVVVHAVVLLGLTGLQSARSRRERGAVESVEGRVEEVTC